MTKKKILQLIIVLIIMSLSYGVYFFVSVKGIEKPKEVVGENSISQGINPVGNFSDGWIKETTSAEEFYNVEFSDYIVVTATDVIPTGVYKRKSWIGPYNIRKTETQSSTRKTPIPEITANPLTDIEFMNQYYLIKLSDGSYINAVLEEQYVKKIKSAGSCVLPIGQKSGVTEKAEQMLSEITTEYNTKATPVLYMINDNWYSENQSAINFKAILWGIGTFILLTILSAFTLGKIFEE